MKYRKILAFLATLLLFLSLCACGGKSEPAPAEAAGTVSFTFTVTDTDGKETSFDITTDKTTVGEALEAEGLISGEEGPYGLYVKTVNGITLDYEKDGKYWAFYVNGEYGSAGVDVTEIQPGETYSFKAE